MIWAFEDDNKSKYPINISYKNGQIIEFESDSVVGRALFRICGRPDYQDESVTLQSGYNEVDINLPLGPYYIEEVLFYTPYIELQGASPSAYAYVVSLRPQFNENNKVTSLKALVYASGTVSGKLHLQLLNLGTRESE